MKKVFSIIAISAVVVLVMSACNRKPATAEAKVSYEDTVGFSQFQAWKAQNERSELDAQYEEAYAKGYKDAAATKTATRRTTATKSGTMTSTM